MRARRPRTLRAMTTRPQAPREPAPSAASHAALDALMRREGGRMLALARRFCGNEAEAEDLVQDVFLQAFRRWDTFDGRSKPSTWLYTIAARACRRRKRGRAGGPRKPVSLDALLPLGDVSIGVVPDEAPGAAEHADLRTRVEAAVAALPAAFRMPFVLREVVGFTPGEVAAILDLAEATVRTRVHRARLLVRAALERGLPRRAVAPAAYSREVCLDLLAAKQRALDRGLDYRFPKGLVCERCAELFATLDLARDLCAEDGPRSLPPRLARAIRARARAARRARKS
jgi:RNA polymerase sigma-70 factor (ECF subfamily)